MNLKFLEGFADEYLQKDEGKGILLTGVVLGMLAQGQVGPNQSIGDAPLFKQLNFGKMQMRDLKRHLARVPELTRAYKIRFPDRLERLAAQAGSLLFKSGAKRLGVDGNFTFSVAFLNAWQYYAAAFNIDAARKGTDKEQETPVEAENS